MRAVAIPPNRTLRKGIAYIGTLLAIVLTAPAHASTPIGASSPVPIRDRVVVVETTGAKERDLLLEETIQELLARLQFRTAFRDDEIPPDAEAARIRLEFFDGGVLVVLLDRQGRDPQVRVVSRAESASMFRETIGHVVLGMIEPLRSTIPETPTAPSRASGSPPPTDPSRASGSPPPIDPSRASGSPPPTAPSRASGSPPPIDPSPAGVSPTPTDPSPAGVSPTPTATLRAAAPAARTGLGSTRIRVSGAAKTGVVLIESHSMTPTLGGEAALRYASSRMMPSMSIGADYLFPKRGAVQTIEADLSGVRLRGSAMLAILSRSRVTFDAGIDGGVDLVWLTPKASSSRDHVGTETSRTQPIMGISLRLRTRLATGLDLLLDGGVDLDLRPRRWVVNAGAGTASTLVELPSLRPFLGLGLDFSLLGHAAMPTESSP